METINKITISVVSHGNMNEIKKLLDSISKSKNINVIHKVILTLNIPEIITIKKINYKFKIIIIKNKTINSFSKNHNNAFKKCSTKKYLVINPDIVIPNKFDWKKIVNKINSDNVLISPNIIERNKIIKPRKFPTLLSYIFFSKNYSNKKVDWISGCFMLFDSNFYKIINGFDELFFLYMEDVDICKRIKNHRKNIIIDNQTIFHNSKRRSLKNFKHFYFHITSIIKYFIKHKY